MVLKALFDDSLKKGEDSERQRTSSLYEMYKLTNCAELKSKNNGNKNFFISLVSLLIL